MMVVYKLHENTVLRDNTNSA